MCTIFSTLPHIIGLCGSNQDFFPPSNLQLNSKLTFKIILKSPYLPWMQLIDFINIHNLKKKKTTHICKSIPNCTLIKLSNELHFPCLKICIYIPTWIYILEGRPDCNLLIAYFYRISPMKFICIWQHAPEYATQFHQKYSTEVIAIKEVTPEIHKTKKQINNNKRTIK